MALSYRQLLIAVPLVIRGGNVPNVVGEAGIGKSALIQKVARRNHARLFTTVVSLVEKGDLAIPVPPLTDASFVHTRHYGKLADVQFGYAHTLIAIIQAAEAHPEQPIYWFLDEFNRGSQAVQSELMNLVLQREVNGLRLPKQVHMIIAENPDASMAGFKKTDYGVVSGDAAIKDRTVRLVMRSDLTDWLKWAQSNDQTRRRQMVHPKVIQFLERHPDLLNAPRMSHDLYPTPRAWQRVSDNLYELEKLPQSQEESLLLDILAGDLGAETAAAFQHFLLHPAGQITLKLFKQDSTNDLRTRFQKMDEAQKESTLRRLFRQVTVTEATADKFSRLIQLLSPDGQYALAVTISHQQILDQLYQRIQENPGKSLRALYVQFERIGQRSY